MNKGYARKAREIYKELQTMKPGQMRVMSLDKAQMVRWALQRELRINDETHLYTTAVGTDANSDQLIIVRKSLTRARELELLLDEALLYIDNSELHGKIMRTLYPEKNNV